MEELTQEDIAQHYSAAMDSVNLINKGKPFGMDDEEWFDTVKRNKDHIDIMLKKTFWTKENLKPFKAALAKK